MYSMRLENDYYPGSQVALVVKNLPVSAGDIRDWFNPWARKNPWRSTWQPIPVFLPGDSHGQRSLVGYIQSMGSQRVRRNKRPSTRTHTHEER